MTFTTLLIAELISVRFVFFMERISAAQQQLTAISGNDSAVTRQYAMLAAITSSSIEPNRKPMICRLKSSVSTMMQIAMKHVVMISCVGLAIWIGLGFAAKKNDWYLQESKRRLQNPEYVKKLMPKDCTVNDINICETLRVYFEHEGYEVKTANDGSQGVEYFKMYEPDIVLLDIMLPKKDGWAVCREIREVSSKPIIMITAKGEVFDKVLGLEMGADDFVVKPFDLKELAVRIKAVLRRCNSHDSQSSEEVIKFENIEISLQKYELKLKGKSVDIPPKELELLYFLASNYNRVFTRDQLLDKVWGFDYLGDSRTVDVHVKRLREKLEGVSDKWILKTVWGVGYKFEILQ